MSMMLESHEKQWTDQPDCVLGCVIFLHIYVGDRGVEVRKDENNDCWYITVGNLFGSQTLRAANCEAVLRVVHWVGNKRLHSKAPVEVPSGCELVSP